MIAFISLRSVSTILLGLIFQTSFAQSPCNERTPEHTGFDRIFGSFGVYEGDSLVIHSNEVVLIYRCDSCNLRAYDSTSGSPLWKINLLARGCNLLGLSEHPGSIQWRGNRYSIMMETEFGSRCLWLDPRTGNIKTCEWVNERLSRSMQRERKQLQQEEARRERRERRIMHRWERKHDHI